ncbi:GNAT family N-acetyltransferase [soil metagenome]
MQSGTEIVVRDARADEHDALRLLTLSAYAQYATIMAPSAWAGLREALARALTTGSGAQRIVAERDGVIVGTVLLFPPYTDAYGGITPRAPWPEIRLLAVAPEARGRGVGKLLVGESIRRARASGADAIGLHTSSSMREAIRLYETLAFTRDPGLDIPVEGAEPIHAYRLSLPASLPHA